MDARNEVLKAFPGYKQIPNIVSPPVETFAGPDKSPSLAAIGNDEIKKIVEANPQFYEGFIAGIPFNNVKASVEEIKRAKDMGAKGIQIYTHMNGEAIDADWTGTLATGSVVLTDLNENVAAEGTAEAIADATAKLESGELHVFDCSTFTVDGQPVTSYMADVDTDPDYTPDTEVVQDGYLAESTARSAPYFQLMIDGIDLLDTNFGG